MKFTVNEDKYIQFGSDQKSFKQGKVYDLDDFQGSVRQSLSYIIRMNSTLFNIIKEGAEKKQEKMQEDNTPKVEETPIEDETVEEDVQTENEQEYVENDSNDNNEKTISESKLNDMTKQELIDFGEKTLGLDIIINNKKQEIYDTILNYLLENDLLISE